MEKYITILFFILIAQELFIKTDAYNSNEETKGEIHIEQETRTRINSNHYDKPEIMI